jgi:hypothetical protein
MSMKKTPDGIYVRIVSLEGRRVTVSTTHPGDFVEIGEPPILIEGVEMEGKGIGEEIETGARNTKHYRLIFTAKYGQSLNRLQLNKRYKLTSY